VISRSGRVHWVLHLHRLPEHKVPVAQSRPAISDLGRGHVALRQQIAAQIKAVEKTLRGKVTKQTFPLNLQIPHTARDLHFPTASAATNL
jgi:hypothetical protein